MSGQADLCEFGDALSCRHPWCGEVEDVKFDTCPVATLALHGALKLGEGISAHVKLAVETDAFGHPSGKPCGRIEGLAVACHKLVSRPNATHTVQFFTGEVVAEIGWDLVHRENLGLCP